jgi:hypothetical protein
VGVYCGIYTGSYNVSNISYMNLPPQQFSFIPPPPIPGVVSTGITFAFTYICIHFISLYSPSYPLSSPPPSSHWCQTSPQGRTCSAFLFSNFVGEKKRKEKRKNMTF